MPTQTPDFWQRIQNFLTDKNRVGIKKGQPADSGSARAPVYHNPAENVRPGLDYPAKGSPPRPRGPSTPATRGARPPSAYFGDIDAAGNITTPDIAGLADTALPDIRSAEERETVRAQGELDKTEQAVLNRETQTESDLRQGINKADIAEREIGGIAEAGKVETAKLPGAVKADVEGIADEFKKISDVDISKIESLGREAVGMALDGKNAAAQAAVEAQQGTTRNAITQINADPSIPQSRKTAMIAQIQTQSSMAIASTIGTNIKDFTAMQTSAMTATMQSVGSAMQSRDAIIGQLGGAEINAVSSAHEAAAGLMKGYDDMAANAVQGAEQLRFQYNNLREVSRQTNNETDLALLQDEFYVGGMPVDFKMTNLQLTRDMMGTDFSMMLQNAGFKTMQEAVAAGNAAAQQTMLYSAMAPFMSGPMAMGLSFLPSLIGGGGGAGGLFGAR